MLVWLVSSNLTFFFQEVDGLNGVKYRDGLGIEHQESCWAESWWGIEVQWRLPHTSIIHTPFYFTLVSTGSLAQQYAHPNATLHPHTPHPQPSATPTGQQQSQHGGSHPAPSPVQVRHSEAFTRIAASFCLLSVFSSARQDARYHVIKTLSSPASPRSQRTALQAVPPVLITLRYILRIRWLGKFWKFYQYRKF